MVINSSLMNRYLYDCASVIIAFSIGFAFGYEFRYREVKKLKNEKSNLIEMLQKIDSSPISIKIYDDIAEF